MTLFFLKLGYYFYKQTNLKEKKKKRGGAEFPGQQKRGFTYKHEKSKAGNTHRKLKAVFQKFSNSSCKNQA